MRHSCTLVTTRRTALAGIVTVCLAAVLPAAGQAQRAPTVLGANTQPIGYAPTFDPLTALRARGLSSLTTEVTATLSYPYGITVDATSRAYVTNLFGHVNVYGRNLKQVGAITTGLSITDVALASPTSLYFDADDTVWVLDAAGMLHGYLNHGTVLPATKTGGNTVGPWGPNVTVWGVADANGGYDEVYENRAQAVQSNPNLYNDYVDGSPYAAG